MIKILYLTTGRYLLGKTKEGLSSDMLCFANDWNYDVETLLKKVIYVNITDKKWGLSSEFYARNNIIFPMSLDEFQIIEE